MATKAKAASSSCLSFLKDALLLPTRNAKLFIPVFLLLAVPSFLLQTTNVFCIQPLAAGILARADEIKNMDPSSPDYARLVAEILKQARELAAVAVAVMVFAMACGFANQVVAFFAASTTYSGDRYSLPELFSEVIAKWRRLRGPLVTVAMAGALNVTCVLLLAELLSLAMTRRHSGPAAALVAAAAVALPFLAFLYLNVVFLVAVAVSAADAERRGAGALRLAWRLMTRVWRKQGYALAVAVHAVAMAPSPLYAAVALGYAKKSVPAGMALIAAYALVSGLVELFYFAAATVFYYQAMESKEVMALDDDYVKLPTGEATV